MDKNPVTPNIFARIMVLGPSSLSYFVLGCAQLVLGIGLSGYLSWLLLALAISNALLGLVHKGVSFDEARSLAAKPLFSVPWPYRTTHIIICACLLFMSCLTLGTESLHPVQLGYLAATLCALAGWLASLVPVPTHNARH